jgi:hypothetical protein
LKTPLDLSPAASGQTLATSALETRLKQATSSALEIRLNKVTTRALETGLK